LIRRLQLEFSGYRRNDRESKRKILIITYIRMKRRRDDRDDVDNGEASGEDDEPDVPPPGTVDDE
jgi:hypothetical protein